MGCTGGAKRLSWFLFPYLKEKCRMKILYLNNDGGGYADHVEIAEGTTVQSLFAQRIPHGRPEDYLIRVNRQPAAADQVLREGDRVSLTPTKIEGALT
jgi:sulfur carrier protein ThiS